jgi:hypothetical protein
MLSVEELNPIFQLVTVFIANPDSSGGSLGELIWPSWDIISNVHFQHGQHDTTPTVTAAEETSSYASSPLPLSSPSVASVLFQGRAPLGPSSSQRKKKAKPSDEVRAQQTLRAFKNGNENDQRLHQIILLAKPQFHLSMIDFPFGASNVSSDPLRAAAIQAIIDTEEAVDPSIDIRSVRPTDKTIKTVLQLLFYAAWSMT